MEKDQNTKKENGIEDIFEVLFKVFPKPEPKTNSTSLTTVNISINVGQPRKGFFKWLLGMIW